MLCEGAIVQWWNPRIREDGVKHGDDGPRQVAPQTEERTERSGLGGDHPPRR